jgi:L-asparaginase II
VSRAVVEVLRGSLVESRHRVHVAVVDAAGRLRGHGGEPRRMTFVRSAIKPIQALPLIEDRVVERFGLSEAELALACGSHSGEPIHVAAARSLLRRAGLGEDLLACGPQQPIDEATRVSLARNGTAPARVHNNCSGKHAGMLALARGHGWPLEGYHRSAHPVQQRMLSEVARWSGLSAEEIPTAVDGCGVVTYALPLTALALAYARLAARARKEYGRDPAWRIVRVMLNHPQYVGGTGRLCTRVMQATGGRIFAKVGAEGVYCAGIPGAELGIVLKIEDGSRRASEPALLGVLTYLGLLSDDELAELNVFAEPEVINTRGEVVGVVRARIALEPADA